MKAKTTLNSAMLLAAQLTAAGSLTAATAAIQRALAGELPVPPPSSSGAGAAQTGAGRPVSRDTIDVEAHWVEDGAAPAPGAGTAARSGFFGESPWQAGSGSPLTGSRFAQAPAGRATAWSTHADASQAKTTKGRMLSGTHAAAAGSREYLLYLPPEAAAGSLSLVVMLHGCTQTPADFAAGTAMNALADQHNFIVLYPAQSKAANQSACWNWFNPRDQRAGAGEPAIIAGMVGEVLKQYRVDPARVHVAGLSAGGAMAAILAQAYPELFASAAVHSGLPSGAAHDLPSALDAMKRGGGGAGSAGSAHGKPVRTIVFHGRQDRTVHPANGRQVVESALAAWPQGSLSVTQENARSAGGRSYVRTIHADAAGRPMVEQWEVQGAGHAWSGGSPAGSYTDPLGPDASAAMVEFFYR
jgi:poly(hydroxyalkanoate) depolymerase family esterase